MRTAVTTADMAGTATADTVVMDMAATVATATVDMVVMDMADTVGTATADTDMGDMDTADTVVTTPVSLFSAALLCLHP